MTDVRAFVQARMTSRRFPGKVLAPLAGRPVLAHVVDAARSVLPADGVVVATSDEESDDPVESYARALGVACFRGPLDDVLGRFVLCADAHPADWILRLSADSPLIGTEVLGRVLETPRDGLDLVTTTFPRTFPRGRNAELVRTETLRRLTKEALEPDDREHVTRWLYRHPERFAIRNVESGDPALAQTSVAVDSLADLARLEDAPS